MSVNAVSARDVPSPTLPIPAQEIAAFCPLGCRLGGESFVVLMDDYLDFNCLYPVQQAFLHRPKREVETKAYDSDDHHRQERELCVKWPASRPDRPTAHADSFCDEDRNPGGEEVQAQYDEQAGKNRRQHDQQENLSTCRAHVPCNVMESARYCVHQVDRRQGHDEEQCDKPNTAGALPMPNMSIAAVTRRG